MVYTGNARGNDRDPTRYPRGPARSSHLPHGRLHMQGGSVVASLLNESAEFWRARVNHVQYGADSLPPGIFKQPDAFWDIRITGAGVHTLTNITMRVDVSNLSPTYDALPAGDPAKIPENFALIPRIPFYFLNRIEIQPDGGTTEDTIYPDQACIDLWTRLSVEEKANVGSAYGINTGGPLPHVRDNFTNQSTYDEDGYPIYPGETREFFFPIISMLTQSKMFLPGKDQDPRIRCYAAQQPVCSDSSPDAIMQIDGADCIISGIIYEDAVLMEMKQHYRTAPTVSRVLVHERQTLDIKNANPGQQLSDLSLTVFNGSFPIIYLYMLRNTVAQEYLYDSGRTKVDFAPDTTIVPPEVMGSKTHNWIPIERITLTDSNGNPVFYNLIPASFLKNVVSGGLFPSTYIHGEKNLYPLVFTTDPERTIDNGTNCGGICMDSNFQLQVVPSRFTKYVDETYGLRVNALRYALLTMSPSGKFKVTKL